LENKSIFGDGVARTAALAEEFEQYVHSNWGPLRIQKVTSSYFLLN